MKLHILSIQDLLQLRHNLKFFANSTIFLKLTFRSTAFYHADFVNFFVLTNTLHLLGHIEQSRAAIRKTPARFFAGVFI